MKLKQILLLLVFVMTMSSTLLISADLIVEENGTIPNYSSISDAMAAASDGDRIFIKNRAGLIPWMENLNVNRSLSFLPFESDSIFFMHGEITLQPAIGREISFIGMQNNDGSITASVNSPAGTPTKIYVLGCKFLSGGVNISGVNYISHIASNQIVGGSVIARYCTITGNQISGSVVISSASATSSEDTLYVVGNRINGTLQWNNDDQYFNISNNKIYLSSSGTAMSISDMKEGSGRNEILNNTIITANPIPNQRAMTISQVPANAFLEIQNNAMWDQGSSGDIGIVAINVAGLLGVYFNVGKGYESFISGTGISELNNVVSAILNPNLTTGECLDGDSINKGNPGIQFTDIDLTRNDIGTTGGSFHFDNFFPLFTGGPRVYLVRMARIAALGGAALKVQADAFAR